MPHSLPHSVGPDPAKFAMQGSEESQQIALFMQCAKHLDKYPELKWLFVIPNGGFRTKSEAGRLRAAGVKPGVPDMFLAIRRGPWSGLWIELKIEEIRGKRKPKISDEQKEWIDHLQSQGFGAMVCHGYLHAWNSLISYLEFK